MLVIFDCDGVLVDSETLAAEVLTEHLCRAGIEASFSETLERYRGKAFDQCVADIGQRLGVSENDPAAADFWRAMQRDTLAACRERLRPIEGVVAVLEQLRAQGTAFCVASNGRHDKMAVTLAVTGILPLVRGRVFSVTDVARGKPAPDLFLHAAARMGVAPERSVVVEDSPTGVRAARAAGMHVLGYAPPHSPVAGQLAELGAQCFVQMSELPALLDGQRRPAQSA